MNENLQLALIAAAVLGALIYLILRARNKSRTKPGCGCDRKRTPPIS